MNNSKESHQYPEFSQTPEAIAENARLLEEVEEDIKRLEKDIDSCSKRDVFLFKRANLRKRLQQRKIDRAVYTVRLSNPIVPSVDNPVNEPPQKSEIPNPSDELVESSTDQLDSDKTPSEDSTTHIQDS